MSESEEFSKLLSKIFSVIVIKFFFFPRDSVIEKLIKLLEFFMIKTILHPLKLSTFLRKYLLSVSSIKLYYNEMGNICEHCN